MKFLVTGASGMLGRAFSKAAKGTYETVGVSRRHTPDGIVCDLSKSQEVEQLFDSHKVDFVIHAAANSNVDDCERNPRSADESNIKTTKFISQACSSRRIPWIYVSTDYVFDGRKRTPYVEEDLTLPINIYGQTKLAGEHYALTCEVSSAVVRTSWLFGHGENPHNFVNFIVGRLKSEEKVQVLDDQTDCPTSMKDLSMALIKISDFLKNDQKVKHDIFHVCNSGGTTRFDMTVFIKECLNLKTKVERLDSGAFPNRPALRPPYAVMSTKKYEKYFGPLRSWKDSLKEYLQELSICGS